MGRSLGCQSSEEVTRVKPFVENVQRVEDSPTVAKLTMEAGLTVLRMTEEATVMAVSL